MQQRMSSLKSAQRESNLQGTMLSLPLPANTLRGIVSFYAIIHLTRAEAAMALQEFARVLQPGGFLLLAFHGGEGEIHSSEWFGQPVAIDATLFEGEEMEQYARQAGLCDVEVVERPPYAFEYQSRRLYLSARVIPRFLS